MHLIWQRGNCKFDLSAAEEVTKEEKTVCLINWSREDQGYILINQVREMDEAQFSRL